MQGLPIEEDGPFPLTPMQQAMLLRTLADPDGATYTHQYLWTIDGPLDTPALSWAWQVLVDRHPMLRTGFIWKGLETPAQVVRRSVTIPWEYRDWRELDADAQGAERDAFLQHDIGRGFRLDEPPAMRLALIRLAVCRHLLVWTAHHTALDGQSRAVLLEELQALYAARLGGRLAELPPVTPFREFVDWLEDLDVGASAEFWRNQFTGHDEPTLLELPTPSPGGADRLSVTPRHRHLPSSLGQRLRTEAKLHGLTMNTLIQGAWGIVLSRYLGRPRVIFGAVRSGRDVASGRFARVVGPLLNTLPVALVVDPAAPLLPWLEKLRATWVEMREHALTPISVIRKASPIPADTTMFDTVLAVGSPRLPGRVAPGDRPLPMGPTELRGRTSYPLAIRVYDHAQIIIEAEHDPRRFHPQDVDRLLEHFAYLLEDMLEAPEGRRVGDLNLIDLAEERRVVALGIPPISQPPRGRLAHDAFEFHCRRSPEAVALIWGHERITYGDLGARTDRVARRLKRAGVRPGETVGICGNREPSYVAAILGVLKAGGAYLPLDPHAPTARLAFILEDARAHWLLAGPESADLRSRLDSSIMVMDLDEHEDESERAQDGQDTPDCPSPGPHDLAYVLYTSGTTGQPKGVAIEHRGLVELIEWTIRRLPGDQTAGMLASASFSFDLSVFELFVPLSRAGKVVLVDDLFGLTATPAAAEVTFVSAVPSVMAAFLTGDRLPPSVAGLMLAGEVLEAQLVRDCYAHPSVRDVYNIYGPTEATVYATLARVDPADATPPIGEPVAGARLYLLDQAMKPVPEGVAGELWIGGPGVARGYLGRPEATATAFRPDPFVKDPEARIYRTGDMVRWRPDGQLDFLGRRDHQVKVRGVRIELGEIESALARHAAVREAVATARAGTPGGSRLVAYIVPRPGGHAEPDGLREHLRSILPEAMIPSAFVVLELLPRTPGGKVDRKALPPPPDEDGRRSEYEPPRSPLEGAIAEIWADILGRDQVGILDNFFELGGHSLTAMRVVARIRDALGIQLPMRALFDAPTVAGLAHRVRRSRSDADAFVLPPIARTNEEGGTPLSFAQQRLWFLDRFEPGTAAYNIPRAFRLAGPLDIEALARSFGEITRRHDVLRTTFEAEDGDPVEVVRPPTPFALPVEDLRNLEEADRETAVERWLDQEATHPFDLQSDPMLRARLLRTAEEEHKLLVTIHHIAADGWSLELLWRELGEVYEAEVEGRAAVLADLPIRYADHAEWQRQWLRGETLERHLGHWRSRLRGLPPLDLPTDRPRPAEMSYRGGSHEFTLDPGRLRRLRELGQREGATLNMTLLAAFYALLHRYSGQVDFAVAMPSANRTIPEIQGMIGFFVNTLVLRVDLSDRPCFKALLDRVRRTSVDAYDHAELPFETLVADLAPAREEGRNPMAQVLFQLLDAPPSDLRLHHLAVKSLPDPVRRVRFDLELHLRPRAGGLFGRFLYSTDLFDAETIARLSDHYVTLLEAAIESIDIPVGRLALLTGPERRRILDDWSGAGEPGPGDADFLAMFRAQVERTPEAVAILSGERSVTFGELETRADCLARCLRGMGVGPDERVALLASRSPGLLVGMLAILKAGGAYVPLDPDLPTERLRFLIQDTAPTAILTESRLSDRLGSHSIPSVLLDGMGAFEDASGELRSLPDVAPEGLCYVMYTSGSTGVPKGVAMTRGALGNLVAWQCRESSAGVGTRTLQYSPISFDVSFQEAFATWCTGGTLVLLSEEERRDPISMLSLLAGRRIERLFLPFVALRELAESVRITGIVPKALREIITAGEQLQITPAIRELCERLPGCKLVNQYGPTETHVATAFLLTGPPASWPALPPIGRPIAGDRVYLLDGELQPVPVGVTGEIYIGGDGLARGYHDRPDLTAERFPSDPFDSRAGRRLYRTGDFGRWRADGSIEFLGRRDHQVKLRGYRVELAEVETALTRHTVVDGCAVVVRDSPPTGSRLIAYWTARTGGSASERDLKEHLATMLPAYMVPATIIRLDALPRNANGKVDRLALPAPSPVVVGEESAGAVPGTELERTLASLWAGALGMDRIGRDDDFFELGGHSLLAMQLIARVSSAVGRPIGIKLLFRHPTVAGLAGAIEACGPANIPAEGIADQSPAKTHGVHDLPPLLSWERRSLLELIACGEMPPVDAAALGYLPDELVAEAGLSREVILEEWYAGLPHLASILDVAGGRIALIYLPRFAADVYHDPAGLRAEIARARALAGRIGARAVSLTGLIPSATDYARDLVGASDGSPPVMTTGHATTVAAVVLSISEALRRAGRDLRYERVGVLGLGSIGSATLRLMLQALPHPRSLALCDLYRKLNRDEVGHILDEGRFRGEVRFLESRPEVPAGFYDCSLIAGATNVPDVLDVERLHPGSIVVDDSGPHCFSVAQALHRVEARRDILVTEGGVLRAPGPVSRTRHVPPRWEPHLARGLGRRLARAHPRQITGCVLSSLLTARFPEAGPTIGLVRGADGLSHYRKLVELGFAAAGPLCAETEVSEEAIAEFRQTYGRDSRAVVDG